MSEEEYWMRRLLVSLKQHAINQCSDVQKLERDKKDRHLKALKEKGLSARQLARLTGISRSIILKPHNRNLTARTVPLVTPGSAVEIDKPYLCQEGGETYRVRILFMRSLNK
jgi:hypothetical protein